MEKAYKLARYVFFDPAIMKKALRGDANTARWL